MCNKRHRKWALAGPTYELLDDWGSIIAIVISHYLARQALELAMRARRLAIGLPKSEHACLIRYADALEYKAAAIEAGSTDERGGKRPGPRYYN